MFYFLVVGSKIVYVLRGRRYSSISAPVLSQMENRFTNDLPSEIFRAQNKITKTYRGRWTGSSCLSLFHSKTRFIMNPIKAKALSLLSRESLRSLSKAEKKFLVDWLEKAVDFLKKEI